MRIIGMIIIIGMVIGAVVSIDYSKFIDLQSLLIVLGGAIGYALAKGKPKEFIINFGDGCVYMGWIGLMIGIIIIGNHYAGTEKIWPAFSIALLPLFYGYFIKLVVVGLKKIDDD
jgi:flagellar motor component MotA